jgi:hypothetical protein
MASLQQRNGSFRFIFRYRGKEHFVTVGKVSREEAEGKAAQVKYLLMRLKQRLIDLPTGVDIVNPAAFHAPLGNYGTPCLAGSQRTSRGRRSKHQPRADRAPSTVHLCIQLPRKL